MSLIQSLIKKVLVFIFKSSADPKATSLAVRMFLLGLVTWLGGQGAQLMGIMCDLGSYCYPITPSLIDQLRHIVDIIAQGIYHLLMVLSVGLGAYGAIRKLLLTALGKNQSLQEKG